jgi:hypothetical protein
LVFRIIFTIFGVIRVSAAGIVVVFGVKVITFSVAISMIQFPLASSILRLHKKCVYHCLRCRSCHGLCLGMFHRDGWRVCRMLPVD